MAEIKNTIIESLDDILIEPKLKPMFEDYLNSNGRDIFDSFVPTKKFLLGGDTEGQTKGRVHLFMTKPDLNLHIGDADNSTSASQNQKALSISSPDTSPNNWLIGNLSHSAPSDSTQLFIPIINNLYTGDGTSLVVDEEGDATEGFKVQNGGMLKYGKGTKHETKGGEFDLEFLELRGLPILNLLKMWSKYIAGCKKGSILRSAINTTQNRLDYGASLYVLVTEPDNETIIYWAKYTGIFPTKLPYSALVGDGSIVNLATSWAYSYRESMKTHVLSELALLFSQQFGTETTRVKDIDVSKIWNDISLEDIYKLGKKKLHNLDGSKGRDSASGMDARSDRFDTKTNANHFNYKIPYQSSKLPYIYKNTTNNSYKLQYD